jgi:hypothetical protein
MPSHLTLRRWQASQARLTDDDMAGEGGCRIRSHDARTSGLTDSMLDYVLDGLRNVVVD